MSEAEAAFRTEAVSVVDKMTIDDSPWQPLRGLAGVNHKVLWRTADIVVGIVRVEPGAEEPGHAHHDASHHMYVLDGSARIGGQTAAAGAFAFVPSGVTHAITDVGPGGCTLLYTYAAKH